MPKQTSEEGKTPPEIAEARIHAALETGAKELDLSNLGLIEFPESIGQLTKLRWLKGR